MEDNITLKNGLNGNNIVQKSTPLQSLWKSSLGLGEFKVLDTYLSRIDSHHPERRTVKFSKEEFERLLGITEVKPAALKKYTDHLCQQIVELETPKRNKQGYHRITLFCEVEVDTDEDGQWYVLLSCSPQAMEYVFNIEHIGYLRYHLKNVLQLKSRYSYVMFVYLLKRCKLNDTLKVTIEELKKLLGCSEDKLYEDYKYFNQRILKKCHEEINEKTTLKYDYEPIRVGRKVKEIKFRFYTTTSALDEEYVQLEFKEARDFEERKELSLKEQYIEAREEKDYLKSVEIYNKLSEEEQIEIAVTSYKEAYRVNLYSFREEEIEDLFKAVFSASWVRWAYRSNNMNFEELLGNAVRGSLAKLASREHREDLPPLKSKIQYVRSLIEEELKREIKPYYDDEI